MGPCYLYNWFYCGLWVHMYQFHLSFLHVQCITTTYTVYSRAVPTSTGTFLLRHISHVCNKNGLMWSSHHSNVVNNAAVAALVWAVTTINSVVIKIGGYCWLSDLLASSTNKGMYWDTFQDCDIWVCQLEWHRQHCWHWHFAESSTCWKFKQPIECSTSCSWEYNLWQQPGTSLPP